MGEATPIGSSPLSLSSEVQAAWARLLWSSPLRLDHRHCHHCRRRKRHGWGHSDHRHRHRRSNLADLSLSFGGWLFWLLVVGWFWLIVVGWSGYGCEIWDGYEILVDGVFFGVGADIGCSVCLSFFFFFGSSGWYWWSVVDLWGVAGGCGLWRLICGVGCCCCCCCWW